MTDPILFQFIRELYFATAPRMPVVMCITLIDTLENYSIRDKVAYSRYQLIQLNIHFLIREHVQWRECD